MAIIAFQSKFVSWFLFIMILIFLVLIQQISGQIFTLNAYRLPHDKSKDFCGFKNWQLLELTDSYISQEFWKYVIGKNLSNQRHFS